MPRSVGLINMNGICYDDLEASYKKEDLYRIKDFET